MALTLCLFTGLAFGFLFGLTALFFCLLLLLSCQFCFACLLCLSLCELLGQSGFFLLCLQLRGGLGLAMFLLGFLTSGLCCSQEASLLLASTLLGKLCLCLLYTSPSPRD